LIELICTRTCTTCRKAVALLEEKGIAFRYREYREHPLSQKELKRTLKLLGVSPREVLRRNDTAFEELGLTGDESDARLIALMAEHPTLLQRPIGIAGDRAVLGRPPEALLALA
jgi:arsenate reductase